MHSKSSVQALKALFYAFAIIALFAGCVSSKQIKVSNTCTYEDSEWGGRERIRPWENYSDNCRMSRKKFHETGKSLNYYIRTDTDNKIIYLIFEDSHSLSDWINDFDYCSLSYEHEPYTINAHGGFVKVWLSGNEKVMQELLEQMENNPSYVLIITGWSMGGAFAHLASEEINWRTRSDNSNPDTGKKPLLITYGCPHLLYGKDMKEYFARCTKACYDFGHVRDSFSKLPPESWRFFIVNRIEIGQDDHDSRMPHTSYGEKQLYAQIHINDTYVTTDELSTDEKD